MRRMVAPGRWADEGPRVQYAAGRGLGAFPLGAAQPMIHGAWPVPRPHGTPPSREPEYRRAYQASWRRRHREAAA